uniref:Uncharacterized protein n=1 Tax=Amphimedon queenslandica TaxID=400682 RepID=A0A1X7VLR8_AMPQE
MAGCNVTLKYLNITSDSFENECNFKSKFLQKSLLEKAQ